MPHLAFPSDMGLDAGMARSGENKSVLIMGIVNVTPDSFSDGGQWNTYSAAMDHMARLVEEGVDILDIGGESTRPGAEPVTEQAELDRVVPLVETAKQRFDVAVSVDTQKSAVAEAALRAGATIINDVSGGRDFRMAELTCQHQADIILMHMQGEPRTMQDNPSYPNGVVRDVRTYLQNRVDQFVEAGVAREKIWIDPGIGFGKSVEHNLQLLKNLDQFNFGGRLVIGTSRKSFLSKILGQKDAPFSERAEGTLASNLHAVQGGATVLRVHEPGPMKRALRTWEAIRDCES